MIGKESTQSTVRMQKCCTYSEVLYGCISTLQGMQTPVAFKCTRVKAIFIDD